MGRRTLGCHAGVGEIKSGALNVRMPPIFKEAFMLTDGRKNGGGISTLEWLVIDHFNRKGLTKAYRQGG